MIEGHAWSDWLEIGDADLDNDHHLQMRLVSALVDAIEEGRPWLAQRLAAHLHDASVAHFEEEERRMLASGYAGRAEHVKEHDVLLKRSEDLLAAVRAEEDALAIAAALDLRSALAGHISRSDRKAVESEQQVAAGGPGAVASHTS